MSLTTRRLLAASALLTASLGACASRHVPTTCPATAALCPAAKQGSPAVLNQAFHHDAPTPTGDTEPAGSTHSDQPQQEHQHGHHR